jgi:4-hydroxy-tetrahydrodipicolinate synthase
VNISGIFPALTTPYHQDGSVALDHFKADLARYNKTGLAGYVVLGSTGESVLLSSAEADSLLAAGKEAAAPGKLLIAGTGAESTAETIARTKSAASLGYDIALVKTPYYYKPAYNSETYLRHFRAVSDASPIPVLLYSVPVFTGITLETPEIVALAQHPNIVGIKDSSGAIQRIVEVAAQAPKGFQILTGAAGVLYPALVSGAKGAILALASPLPEKCVELFELFQTGQHADARTLQQHLALASKVIVSEGGIAGVKHAMDLRGYHGGLPRLPLLPLANVNKASITHVIAQFEPATARA